MSKNTLNLEEQTEAIVLYLKGSDPKSIAEQFNVDTKAIKEVVENKELRTNVEKQHIELTAAKEARKIDEVKESIINLMKSAADEAMDLPNKMLFMDKASKMISDLDRISRLNREQNTSNDMVVNKNVKVDVAAIIKELQTPDQKRAFLRNQLVINANEED